MPDALVIQFRSPVVIPRSMNALPTSVKGRIAFGKEKRVWRQAAMVYARNQWGTGFTKDPLPACTVHVTIPFTTNRRRDPHNYTGTVVKPIVDGLVDARLWPDDNPDWVTVLDPTCAVGGLVVVTVTPR